jgi:hypothetical protein
MFNKNPYEEEYFPTLLRYAASCHDYIFPDSVFSTAADVPEGDNDLVRRLTQR